MYKRARKFLRDWLGLSTTEINGFLIFLPLLLLILCSQPVYHSWVTSKRIDYTADSLLLQQLRIRSPETKELNAEIKQPLRGNTPQLVAFNPNTVSENDLIEMGLARHLSKRIAAYRQNGGEFRVKSDLLKIYGMDSSFYNRVFAFIDLPEKVELKKPELAVAAGSQEKKQHRIEKIDLNKADTSQLMRIQGIGKTLSKRIIAFRESLGGFTHGRQLAEVYGLDSLVARKVLEQCNIDPQAIKRINLNSADEQSLSRHPYIRKKIASAIIAYRFQHGPFRSIDDITHLRDISPQLAEKLIPYLTITD